MAVTFRLVTRGQPRRKAADHGRAQYNGAPCDRHPDERGLRWTASGNCVECGREADRARAAKRRREAKRRP